MVYLELYYILYYINFIYDNCIINHIDYIDVMYYKRKKDQQDFLHLLASNQVRIGYIKSIKCMTPLSYQSLCPAPLDPKKRNA